MENESKQLLFFKNRIKSKIESLKPYISNQKYKLYCVMLDECQSLEEIKAMAEIDFQFELAKYIRNLELRLNGMDTTLEELKMADKTLINSSKGVIIKPAKRSKPLITEEELDDMLDNDLVMTAAANSLAMRLAMTPKEELQQTNELTEEEEALEELDSINLDEADSDYEDDLGDIDEDTDEDEELDAILDEEDSDSEDDLGDTEEDEEAEEEPLKEDEIDFGTDSGEHNIWENSAQRLADEEGVDLDHLDDLFDDTEEDEDSYDEDEVDPNDLDSLFEDNEDDEEIEEDNYDPDDYDYDSEDESLEDEIDNIFEEEDDDEDSEESEDAYDIDSLFDDDDEDSEEDDYDSEDDSLEDDIDSIFDDSDNDYDTDDIGEDDYDPDEEGVDPNDLDSLFSDDDEDDYDPDEDGYDPDEEDDEPEDDETDIDKLLDDTDSETDEDDYDPDEEDDEPEDENDINKLLSALDDEDDETNSDDEPAEPEDSSSGEDDEDSIDKLLAELDMNLSSSNKMSANKNNDIQEYLDKQNNNKPPRSREVDKIFVNGTERGQKTQTMYNGIAKLLNLSGKQGRKIKGKARKVVNSSFFQL